MKGEIFLGIDPGTNRIGFGAISKKNNALTCLKYGVIEIGALAAGKRLLILEKKLAGLFKEIQPDVVGVEKLFFSKNQKTAMSVAEAKGVILLAAEKAGIPVREFSPTTVKQRICGYGATDKKGVIKLIQLFLGIEKFDSLDDAADALAIAIVTGTETG